MEGSEKVVTLSEVKDLIKAESLKPSDLFSKDSLVEDPVMKGFVEAERKEASGGEWARGKRVQEAFDAFRKEAEEKEVKSGETITELRKVATGPARDKLLETEAEKRELSEKQLKYIKQGIDRFKVEDPEKLESEFKAHLDSEIEVFDKLEKNVFGEGGGGDKESEGKPGAGPGKVKGGSGSPESEDDDFYTKPLE